MTQPQAPRLLPVFVVTALGAFLAGLDLSVVNVAFPDLAVSFPRAGQAALAWVITAYAIVFGALLVTGGRTADRLGRRRVYLGGVAVFLLASLLCGLAPSVPVLVAARVLQGAGAAFLVPASIGLLIAAVPPERRTQTVALWGGVSALAVATGPSLGAVLVDAGGWRWAFLVNLPVGAALLAAGRRVLIETEPDRSASRPDYPGVLALALGLGALVLAVSQGGTWGWTDPRVLGALGAAAALGGWVVARSRTHPEPVVDPALFRSRSFTAANVATLVYAVGFFPMLLGNVLFLVEVWEYSVLAAGLAITPGPLVVAAVSGPAGRLSGRVGPRPVVLAGVGTMAAGLLWFVAAVGPVPSFLAVWFPGTLLVGLGVGLTFPVLAAAAVAGLPPHRLALGSAVNQTARQIGGALGIAALVVVLGEPASVAHAVAAHHRLWLFCAVAVLLAGGPAAFLPRPVRRAPGAGPVLPRHASEDVAAQPAR